MMAEPKLVAMGRCALRVLSAAGLEREGAVLPGMAIAWTAPETSQAYRDALAQAGFPVLPGPTNRHRSSTWSIAPPAADSPYPPNPNATTLRV
jgi:hypothetical protein